MKIVAYSDLHAHPFKNGFLTEEGRNSRVVDATNVIQQVYDHAEEVGASYVLFGGDLFDKRKSIDVDTFNQVHAVIAACSERVKTIMIPGNHDQANKSGTIHALERFNNSRCKVFCKPEWVMLDNNTALFGVPYVDDGELIAQAVHQGLKEKPSKASQHILMIHYGIQGAKVSASDYVLPCELELGHLSPTSWDLILSGHYHLGQQIGPNFHYIGSAMQHRWDDAGFDKTFLEFDSDTGDIRRIPTVAPKFVVAVGKTKDYDVSNAFVRIVRDYEIEEKKKVLINEKLRKRGALSVEYRLERKVVADVEERIEFSSGSGPLSIIEDYINSDIINNSGLDKNKLLSIGKELINRAQNA